MDFSEWAASLPGAQSEPEKPSTASGDDRRRVLERLQSDLREYAADADRVKPGDFQTLLPEAVEAFHSRVKFELPKKQTK